MFFQSAAIGSVTTLKLNRLSRASSASVRGGFPTSHLRLSDFSLRMCMAVASGHEQEHSAEASERTPRQSRWSPSWQYRQG